MIQVTGVYKAFGRIQALNGISFQAPGGEITGLLGPNGAGKTTCLRILYTLLRPDSGQARVDGFDTLASPMEVQRRIGALPDSHGLYPRLTGRENIRYYGRLQGMKGEELEQAIQRISKLLDMQDIIDRKTEGFSSGQRVKVAIARSLVHNPPNILLDEPTNGLDVVSTRAMRTFILRLRDEGKCVLFSSHIMQEVSALCNRVVILSQGVIAASGTAEELIHASGAANLEDAFIAATGSEEGLTRA